MLNEINNYRKKRCCALILGGYVNGYSIISELYEEGVNNIWLFDYYKSISCYSNKITGFTIIKKNSSSLLESLLELKKDFEYIICYPTDDLQIEMLNELHKEISHFCFLPFNTENIKLSLDKGYQYDICKEIGIPYPRTLNITNSNELSNIDNLMFPILVKPNTRLDKSKDNIDVFRNLFLENNEELKRQESYLTNILNQGVALLFSEYIPGDDSMIYAYTAYRSKRGEILNEWIGKKLNQFPDNYGVFSSASNEAPEEVQMQGRKLLEFMNIYGIAQPEFKYDYRDGQYKLMEINLRSMMWHRLGNLTGVKLQFTQWNDATGNKVVRYSQNLNNRIHFVYLKHELLNLISRKNYLKKFKYNNFGADQTYYAIYDKNDMKPFLTDLLKYPKGVVYIWLKVLKAV